MCKRRILTSRVRVDQCLVVLGVVARNPGNDDHAVGLVDEAFVERGRLGAGAADGRGRGDGAAGAGVN
jgi:hypothetical protein